jgi:photosystem II stability/assembly factor-like uncharacterized protein
MAFHKAVRPLLVPLCALAAGALAACAQTLPPDFLHDLHWRNIGPFRGGRTHAAAGVPSQPNIFYVGQVNGGVWKSDDYGRTWIPLFDSQPTQSIGSIAVAPSDPNTIYVGSGEGLQRPDLSIGDGIYRSTDAGQTWTHLGLRDGQQIPALAVDPRDRNRVYAAVLGHPYGANAERGIFRSADGGATWEKVLYIDENTGACDIQIDPQNPDTLYAGFFEGRHAPWEFGNNYAGPQGGLFKSTDGGRSWSKLTNGLPAVTSQAYLSISRSNPRRLYALLPDGIKGPNHIYRSDYAGASWTATTTDPRPQATVDRGDNLIEADPVNPDVVYVTSMVTWRSTDAGKTWSAFKGGPGGDDYQNLWINPLHPSTMLLVSDQGATVSVNAGRTWSSWYNQPTAQLYHAIATSDFPYKVCGGQQESGSVCISSRGNDGAITSREWHPVGIIEYGYAAPDPLNPDLIYGAGRGQVSRYRISTGQVQSINPAPLNEAKYRADRTQPIVFSPVDPHILYYAANVVFRTADGGDSWQTISPDLTRPKNAIPASVGLMAAGDPEAEKKRGVIYSLAPSHHTVNTLWAGTDEGLIWITRDGGAHWKDITPPDLGPWSKITQLEAGHFDDLTAYASVSRFRADDLAPRIFRTHDGGASWQLIVGGLSASEPIDTVREDPVRKGLLFTGSEKSVSFSLDDGDHWQSLQLNLPHTSMRDLWIKDSDLIVATHGRSFWILDDITPLRQIRGQTLTSSAWLARPAAAWRVRDNNNPDTPLPGDEPFAENPPDGAVIDYFLHDAVDTVRLEILDASGKVVRRYSSRDQPLLSPEILRQLPVTGEWGQRSAPLAASSGLHRFVWDLHYQPPDTEHHSFPIAAVPFRTPLLPRGPMALPGAYTVRLIAGAQTLTGPLTVRMDPRVKSSPVSLRRLFDAEVRLSSLVSQTTQAIRVARSVVGQLGNSDRKAHASLDELNGLNEQIAALYGDIDGVDSAPTAQQSAAVAKLGADCGLALARWSKFISEDIPVLNRQRSTPIRVEPDARKDSLEAY